MIRFSQPLYLLIIPVLLLLFYIFRLTRRRMDIPVPSILIWKIVNSSEQAPVHSFQYFRNLILILQFMILFFGIFALSDPALVWTGESGDRVVVCILDTSASMQCSYGEDTRFSAARAESLKIIQSLKTGEKVALIRLDAVPDLLLPVTEDISQAVAIVKRLAVSDEASDLSSSLDLAGSILSPYPGSTVFLFSDGTHELPQDRSSAYDLVTKTVGDTRPNLGITNFSLRESPVTTGSYHLLIEVYATPDWSGPVDLRLAVDDQEFSQELLPISPGRTFVAARSINAVQGSVLSVRIANPDCLPVDNHAAAVVPSLPRPRVLLVTEGNFFLERVLAVLTDFDTYISDTPRISGSFDIYVYDNPADKEPIPSAGCVLFLKNEIQAPVNPDSSPRPVVDWIEDHPVFQGVDLGDVSVLQPEQIPAALHGGTSVLARTPSNAVITAAENGTREVYFIFDLADSTLPFSPVFPVLMSNALWWSYAGIVPEPHDSYRTGNDIVIISHTAGGQIRLSSAENHSIEGTAVNHMLNLSAPSYTGLYDGADRSTHGLNRIAVNLASMQESQIHPKTSYSQDGPGNKRFETAGREDKTEASFPLRRFFIILALCALYLEWRMETRRWDR